MGRTRFAVLVAAFAALLVLALWATREREVPPPAALSPGAADEQEGGHARRPAGAPGASAHEPAAAVREAASGSSDGTGSLRVRALHSRDDAPAVGMQLRLRSSAAAKAAVLARAQTDAEGVAAFERLPAGELWLGNDRGDAVQRVLVCPGSTAEAEFVVRPGMRFRGEVLDQGGAPVAGALVELWKNDEREERSVVAVTDARGAFVVLDAHVTSSISARTAVHQASTPLRMPDVKLGKVNRLVLGGPGCPVSGHVVDATGAPVADAVVFVGAEQPGKPWPALVRTDHQGRFTALGVAEGRQPFSVRVRGYAGNLQQVQVFAGMPPLRIALGLGAALRGVARRADGAPVAAAFVQLHETTFDVLPSTQAEPVAKTSTAADGTFVLEGLPAGEFVVVLGFRALQGIEPRCSERVVLEPGKVTEVDLEVPAAQDPFVQVPWGSLLR